jgi:4-amino-4-deoxy-L-arabinose transferase-like glycosyltransferase
MPTHWRHQAIIIAAAAIVLFTNLGRPALWDRDEPRNAGAAREMIERGDWVVPTFNGELRVHKPVLVNWLIMSAYAVFGVNEFAARFWSAVLGIGTCLLTYHLGRLLYRAEVGLWAALLLATSLMFVVASRAATPDASLIFCFTLAIYLFARGSMASLARGGAALPQHARTYVAMYAAMGVGVLSKGPVAVVLPTAVLGMYLLIMLPRKKPATTSDSLGSRLARMVGVFEPRHFLRTTWALRPLTAIGMVLLIAGPWYVWVAVRTDGAWLREFILTHNTGRFMNSAENHRGPIVYYLAAILIGMLPGAIFMGPALTKHYQRLRDGGAWRAADVLTGCWAGVVVVFFSLASTKLPSYVLPAYPAIALLLGAFVHTWLTENATVHRAWMPACLACLALMGAGLLIGLPIAAHFLLPGEKLIGLIGLVPLIAAAACYVLMRRGELHRAATVFATSAVLLTTLAMGYVSVRVDRYKNDRPLLSMVRDEGDGPKRIASYRHLRSTYSYYAQQRVEEFGTPEQVADFFAGRSESYLLICDEDLPAVQKELPADVAVLARRPRFLKQGDLVLLGRPALAPRVARRPGERAQ